MTSQLSHCDMSSSSFHESDLVQAIAQLRVSNIFGYRDFLAYLSSLSIPIIRADELGEMTYINSGSYSTILSYKSYRHWKGSCFQNPQIIAFSR